MPYNPAGLFSLVASYFAQPGTTIRTEQHNPVFEDVGAALSSVLLRDGRAPMTGPLNMNGFAINGVVAGNSPGSVATLAQAMPIGAVIDFAGSIAPAGWMFCYGQEISRTTYAVLFSAIGTQFGIGNGSTTFNLPDCRGRVTAGKDNMGGTAAGRLTTAGGGVDGATLGAPGGSQAIALSQSQLPAISPTFTGINDPVTVTSTTDNWLRSSSFITVTGTSSSILNGNASAITSTGTFTPRGSISLLGSGDAHGNTQPTIVFNKIIRVSYDG